MTWAIVTVVSTTEAPSSDALRRYRFATFYPKREVLNRAWQRWHRWRGKMPKGKCPPKFVRKPWVYGYVFVDLQGRPVSELIDACRHISETSMRLRLRVLAPGGEPYRVTDADMARMRDVPSRVKAMVDAARRAEEAAEAARRPAVGHLALILSGPLAGHSGTVEAITGDDVLLTLVEGLKPVTAARANVEKCA